MWLFRLSDWYCVSTKIRRRSACKQLLTATSINR